MGGRLSLCGVVSPFDALALVRVRERASRLAVRDVLLLVRPLPFRRPSVRFPHRSVHHHHRPSFYCPCSVISCTTTTPAGRPTPTPARGALSHVHNRLYPASSQSASASVPVSRLPTHTSPVSLVSPHRLTPASPSPSICPLPSTVRMYVVLGLMRVCVLSRSCVRYLA